MSMNSVWSQNLFGNIFPGHMLYRDHAQRQQSHQRTLAELLERSSLQFIVCNWRCPDQSSKKEALAFLNV
ncbi:hypothetical protein NC652_015474 [Populus alba x Populus x berolinensis]|nr:hypothetical protein NC652_015474 [Populus alba x Populus x berolinensis]